MPELHDVRLVLVQARSTPDIAEQEQLCFLERCRLQRHQLRPVSVLADSMDVRLFDGADALMIGGAGEFSAAGDYPWMPAVLELVLEAYRRGVPTFGSCWGHQVMARALGGRVIHDSALAEIGCHDVTLTDEGRLDPLFGNFPPRFLANMGHHDRVVALPPTAVELAFSDTQPYQAFRIDGKPMYGTQFHSELDAVRVRERLYRYREHYPEVADDDSFLQVLENLSDTTEVDHLLYDFLVTFVYQEAS